MCIFHVQRQAAVNGKPDVYSVRHVPDTAACILIGDELLFGRNIYFTHSLIRVHIKRLKFVNPRHLNLSQVQKFQHSFGGANIS